MLNYLTLLIADMLRRRPPTIGRPGRGSPDLAASAGSPEPWHLLEAQDR